MLGFDVVEIDGSFSFYDSMDKGRNLWEVGKVAEVVERAVVKTGAEVVVTFDRLGVSGHRNHIEASEAVGLFARGQRGKGVTVLHLVTRGVVEKYFWWTGVGWVISGLRAVLGRQEVEKEVIVGKPGLAVRAMEQHASQWVWYRRLFIHFSSYTSFIELVKADEM